VEIGCRVYKPRRPRESPLCRLVERHLEELLRVWPERFAPRHGPLRAAVERVLREFLRCGLLEHGFARLWCGSCRRSVLVAFSRRGRSFCPSCEKKKQLLWAEWLREQVFRPSTTVTCRDVAPRATIRDNGRTRGHADVLTRRCLAP